MRYAAGSRSGASRPGVARQHRVGWLGASRQRAEILGDARHSLLNKLVVPQDQSLHACRNPLWKGQATPADFVFGGITVAPGRQTWWFTFNWQTLTKDRSFAWPRP